MKKLFAVICIMIGLLLFPASAKADSPLTATPFYVAYQDLSIVREASTKQMMNQTIADYLENSNNPIDVKAAVINALCNPNGSRTNAQDYCRLIYHKTLEELGTDQLSGDQLFCIGYLLALDQYDAPLPALNYLKLAEKKIDNSFTVSIIRAITEAMAPAKGLWEYIEPVIKDSTLTADMRQDGVNQILDYMATYESSNKLMVSKNYVMIMNEKSQTIYLYGTFTIGACPYQLTKSSNIASAVLSRDSYGIYYITLTGLKNGSSSVTVTNTDGKKATIKFDVVSKETYSRLANTQAYYIGNTTSYIGKTKNTLSTKEKPFLKNNKPYIPLKYSSKAIGAACRYNSKSTTFKITCGQKTIIIKKGSKTASVGGKAFTLSYKPVISNNIWFIAVQDYAKLFNKRSVYDNGLIFISDQALRLDSMAYDYIRTEIASLITKGKLTIHEPIAFLKNGKYGYRDYSGKIIISPRFDKAYDFSDGYAVAGAEDADGNVKYGYIDKTGNYVLEPRYRGAYSFSGGLAPVQNDEGTLWGYIDISGRLVLPYSYTDCRIFKEGLAAVKMNTKWGYINSQGEFVITPLYDQADSFLAGLALVKQGEAAYNINVSGNNVIFYNNGCCYIGEVKNGLPGGSGVYTWPDGRQYTGEFTEGKITGKGECTLQDGIVEKGTWKDGVLQQ